MVDCMNVELDAPPAAASPAAPPPSGPSATSVWIPRFIVDVGLPAPPPAPPDRDIYSALEVEQNN